MNPLDPTIDRLRQTFGAVADQVADAPPAFVAVPVTPTPPPRRKRVLLVAAACLVVLGGGVVAFALTRDTRSNPPAIEPPSVSTTVPTTAPPALEHLVPGPEGTITQIALQGDAANPQPLEYQLGYAGTVDGRPAQLMITADDFSRTRAPDFTLENHGCDVNGDGSPRFPGTIIPVGDHQACLITNIQNALHLGWIDDDGVSILLQSSGLSVEQLEAVAGTVRRDPGDALAVELTSAPPAGLELAGRGTRPLLESVWISFTQDGCSYIATSSRADPVASNFDPYSAGTTIRGKPGRIVGIQNVTWVDGDTRLGVGINAPDVRAVADQCNSAAVAESLVTIDEAAWEQLLAEHADIVEHQGG